MLIVWNVVAPRAARRSTSRRSSSRRRRSTPATSGSASSSPRAASGSRSELPRRAGARQGRAAAPLRRLDRAHGRGVGRGGARATIWVAVPFVVGGAAGNGAAIICNQDPRPARRARPLPRARARDDHEHELRRCSAWRWPRPACSPTRTARAPSGWRAGASTSSPRSSRSSMTRWLPVRHREDDVRRRGRRRASGVAAGSRRLVNGPAADCRSPCRAAGACVAERRGASPRRSSASRRSLEEIEAARRGETPRSSPARAPSQALAIPVQCDALAWRGARAGRSRSSSRACVRAIGARCARAISLVEDGDPLAYPLVRELYPETGRAAIVGVTGPPGVGQVDR